MTKRIPLYPRIEHAKKRAKEFIVKSGIESLPINLLALCRKNKWTIKSVSETESITDEIDPFEVRFNSDCDAKTYLTTKGRYFIVYDDAVLTEGRILWTIAHEIGHIVLKHLEDFEQTEVHKGLSEAENSVLEKEADAFASELLAPSEILIHCKCVKKNAIIKLCGLSGEAAENKEKGLKNYRPDSSCDYLDLKIYKQFFYFINNKEFFHTIHLKVCPICKNYIFSTEERFCRICGVSITASTLIKGIIYNDGPDLDKNGKVIICPKCMNGNISKNDTVCQKCGTTLINQCTGNKKAVSGKTCSKTHTGSTRFCYECGSVTSFFHDGIIPTWQESQALHIFKRSVLQQLEADEDTGKVFREWDYLLNLVKEDGNFELFVKLKGSFAKLDYDTLFIYSDSSIIKYLINDKKFTAYITNLFKRNLGISIIEVLLLETCVNSLIAAVAEQEATYTKVNKGQDNNPPLDF